NVALGFISTNPSSTEARRINTFDRVSNNNSYEAPRLHVEWEVNQGIVPGTPGQPDYESTLSCIGSVSKGIVSGSDDACQRDSVVRLNESSIPFHDDAI